MASCRKEFPYDRGLWWYPPHQARAARQLQQGLHHIDMVVEVRDARIPLTSVNPIWDRVLGRRERLVLYNKADLANPNFVVPLSRGVLHHRNEHVLFTNADAGSNVRRVLDFAVAKCRSDPQRFPYLSMVVVGNPNVGKSTLINALRRMGVQRGKVTAVGARAGVTTTIQTRVKICADPPIYLVDTPGIYDPHVANAVDGLKVALTGGTNDQLTQMTHVADYLLFRMNNSMAMSKLYPQILGLPNGTDAIESLLAWIAIQRELVIDRTGGAALSLARKRAAEGKEAAPTRDLTHVLMDAREWSQLGAEARTHPEGIASVHAGMPEALRDQDAYAHCDLGTRDNDSTPTTLTPPNWEAAGLDLDLDRAASWLVDLYRQGAFGRLTLDNCAGPALESWFTSSGSKGQRDAVDRLLQ
jgi:mitochondrial GTPase 1